MELSDISELFKSIKRIYPLFVIPRENRSEARDMLHAWHECLGSVSVEVARENLRRYALDPDNKYPPHPGALAKPLDKRSGADHYHDHMRQSGLDTLAEYDRMQERAVGPTPEQRERILRALHKSS
ncbi:hypothetical protein [Paenibacillus sp. YYML68]|uniref:hypothetical protein n=1 Tax=Paenibacillus sp. YYML68 TaxID=2909250 RepID=UPI0024928114|nr:hypothetical protein [Paenibacillus sp. YYML68]